PGFPLTFKYSAEGEAPEGKADILEANGPANFSARFVIARETHLPVMLIWTPPTPAARGASPAPSARGGSPAPPAPTSPASPAPASPASPAPPAPPASAPPAPPA